MRKLFTAIATVTLLLAGSLIWKAEAAMTTGVGDLAPAGLIADCSDMLGATLAAGTSLLAPATPVRVGGMQAQASAQLVQPRPWFAASRSLAQLLCSYAAGNPGTEDQRRGSFLPEDLNARWRSAEAPAEQV